MLFQIDVGGDAPAQIFDAFWDERQADDDVRAFSEHLVRGVMERRDEMDGLIAGVAERWRVERMPVVDRNVLRLALFEMLDDPGTPRPVIIDEAIEIGKKYGSEQSGSFINGILDALRRAAERGALGPGAASDDGSRR